MEGGCRVRLSSVLHVREAWQNWQSRHQGQLCSRRSRSSMGARSARASTGHRLASWLETGRAKRVLLLLLLRRVRLAGFSRRQALISRMADAVVPRSGAPRTSNLGLHAGSRGDLPSRGARCHRACQGRANSDSRRFRWTTAFRPVVLVSVRCRGLRSTGVKAHGWRDTHLEPRALVAPGCRPWPSRSTGPDPRSRHAGRCTVTATRQGVRGLNAFANEPRVTCVLRGGS